jgi:hypothetical protein
MPNWQSVINDFAKTLITLSSAVLAASITVASNFFEEGSSEFYLLGGAWLFLFVSIVASLFSITKLISHLKTANDTQAKLNAIRGANTSYITFGMATFLFLLIGVSLVFCRPDEQKPGLGEARERFLRDIYEETRGWRIVRLGSDAQEGKLTFILENVKGPERLGVGIIIENDRYILVLVEES